VVIAAVAGWTRTSAEPPTIILVPFYNETGRAELDTVARAIGDATVARLAAPERLQSLSVIGNAPSLANPFARAGVQEIARTLGAHWVLIGQLKADGRQLRIIAHLIRASDMKHLWAQTFDDERFALDGQSRVAEAIAAAVAASLTSAPK
jgi:TolB-like protein